MGLFSMMSVSLQWRDTHFSTCVEMLPIIPIVKLAKIWILLNKVAHIERQSVFQLETLCNPALDVAA